MRQLIVDGAHAYVGSGNYSVTGSGVRAEDANLEDTRKFNLGSGEIPEYSWRMRSKNSLSISGSLRVLTGHERMIPKKLALGL